MSHFTNCGRFCLCFMAALYFGVWIFVIILSFPCFWYYPSIWLYPHCAPWEHPRRKTPSPLLRHRPPQSSRPRCLLWRWLARKGKQKDPYLMLLPHVMSHNTHVTLLNNLGSKPCHTSLITPTLSSTLKLIKPWSITFTASPWLLRFPEPSSMLKLGCPQALTLISLSIV